MRKKSIFTKFIFKNCKLLYLLNIFKFIFTKYLIKKPVKIAVCTICRNEKPYLLEWIAWNKIIGFDKIFVYDNQSNDGTSELLVSLDMNGEIKRISWPRLENVSPQKSAYKHFIQGPALDFDWVFICDIDEFICFSNLNLKSFLKKAVLSNHNVSAISIPWLIFGSSGQEKHDSKRLVTERFTKCEENPDINVKTIFRPEYAYDYRVHHCELSLGDFLDNELKPARWDKKYHIDIGNWKMLKPKKGYVLLHHYFTKSREEWNRRKKLPRVDYGKIMLGRRQDDTLFESFINQKYENTDALKYKDSLKRIINRLGSQIYKRAQYFEGFKAELILKTGELLIFKIKGVKKGTKIRVLLNDKHEYFVKNLKIIKKTDKAIVLNINLINEKIENIKVAPVGGLHYVEITKENFLTRRQSFKNIIKYLPDAEDLIFKYFFKLSDTIQNINFTKKIVIPPFKKFPHRGAFIKGVQDHIDDLSALKIFLNTYINEHGNDKATKAQLEKYKRYKNFYLSEIIQQL